jgi:hypothetical protein
MQDTNSQQEPSELVKADSYLMRLWTTGRISLGEAERKASGPQRLKEAFSSIPWHAERAANNPNYWKELYGSGGNW